MNIKTIFMTLTGILGSLISGLFGGWSAGMSTLLIFMIIDYITGLMTAFIFHNSPKTQNGGLESRAGFKGLCRKGMILMIILVACRLDITLGTNYIRDAVAIAFIANESISILENAGLMGVPIPKALKKAIEILKSREEVREDESMY